MKINKSAFDGLASNYQLFRPSYPEIVFRKIIRILVQRFPRKEDWLFMDVGCGTGISTRLLQRVAGANVRVVGLDVSRDMLQQARSETVRGTGIKYHLGAAEKLPCPDHHVHVILVAQAMQWFDRAAFYPEADRALKKDGLLAIVQNNRLWHQSKLLDDYETFLEKYSPGYSRNYRDIDFRFELNASHRFCALRKVSHTWNRKVTAEEFVGMAMSSTKVHAAIKAIGEKKTVDKIRALLESHTSIRGTVTIPYITELFLAQPIREGNLMSQSKKWKQSGRQQC